MRASELHARAQAWCTKMHVAAIAEGVPLSDLIAPDSAAAPTAKCVDDHAAMKGYTGMNCTAIKAGGACAQITGNAQLKAIGAHTKCGCSCPVAATATATASTAAPTAASTMAPTAKCVDHDQTMKSLTHMSCKKIKAYSVCPNVKSDPRLRAFGANEYCGCSCELKVHTVDLPW